MAQWLRTCCARYENDPPSQDETATVQQHPHCARWSQQLAGCCTNRYQPSGTHRRPPTSLPRRRRVQGAEHLLAALEMLGVENCRIEIEGGHEVPIIDGSAQGWCVEIQAVRLTPLPT